MSRFLARRTSRSHADVALELEQKENLLPAHGRHARSLSAAESASLGHGGSASSARSLLSGLDSSRGGVPGLGRVCARRRTVVIALALLSLFLIAGFSRGRPEVPELPTWDDVTSGFGLRPEKDVWLGPSTARRWNPPLPPQMKVATSAACHIELAEYRQRYNFSADAVYARQFVRRRSSGIWRGTVGRGSLETPISTLVSLDTPLLPNPAPLASGSQISACSGLEGALSLPVQTEVERPGPMRILFGAATTRSRVLQAIPEWLWLQNAPGARLLLLVEEADEADPHTITLEALRVALRAAHIDAEVEASDLYFERRYMSLLPAFRRHRKREQWFATIDDDTAFIRGLEPIHNMLRKYDARSDVIVGAISENQGHFGPIGRIAFGGAGIFMSHGFVEHLTAPQRNGAPSLHAECDKEHDWGGGDLRISHCAFDKLHIEVSIETALHQMDLIGSSHGVLESGQEVSTMHHYKSWNHFDPTHLMRAGAICHGICVMQRYDAASRYWEGQDNVTLALRNISLSSNPRTVFSYGVSLTQYPTLPDLLRVEKTWGDAWDHGVFVPSYNFGPLRAPQGEGSGRFTWNLEGQHITTHAGGEKWLHQLYVRRTPDQPDSVVEYVWLEK